MLKKCQECGSLWNITICMKIKKPLCRSCCDIDCQYVYSCWGRYY